MNSCFNVPLAGETIVRNNTVAQAIDCRDAMAKVWSGLANLSLTILVTLIEKVPKYIYVMVRDWYE